MFSQVEQALDLRIVREETAFRSMFQGNSKSPRTLVALLRPDVRRGRLRTLRHRTA